MEQRAEFKFPIHLFFIEFTGGFLQHLYSIERHLLHLAGRLNYSVSLYNNGTSIILNFSLIFIDKVFDPKTLSAV